MLGTINEKSIIFRKVFYVTRCKANNQKGLALSEPRRNIQSINLEGEAKPFNVHITLVMIYSGLTIRHLI